MPPGFHFNAAAEHLDAGLASAGRLLDQADFQLGAQNFDLRTRGRDGHPLAGRLFGGLDADGAPFQLDARALPAPGDFQAGVRVGNKLALVLQKDLGRAARLRPDPLAGFEVRSPGDRLDRAILLNRDHAIKATDLSDAAAGAAREPP